jgi:hypothetical protein
MSARSFALLLPVLIFAPPAQAASRSWSPPLDDPFKFGFEILGYWGSGIRGAWSPDVPVVDSVGLRVGATLPFRFQEGSHIRHGIYPNPYDRDVWSAGPLTPYFAPMVDLDLWGPLELELTAGFALIYVPWSIGPYPGFTGGAALRLDFEEDVPVTFNAGVLVMSDACLCAPRLALDFGPRFTW